MSKILWDPDTGAHHVFRDSETPPAHFLPHHPEDTAKLGDKPSDADTAKPLTKDELVTALTDGGIAFKATEKVEELTTKLVSALKTALTDRQIEFTEDEHPRSLLAKVQEAA